MNQDSHTMENTIGALKIADVESLQKTEQAAKKMTKEFQMKRRKRMLLDGDA